MLYLQPNLLTDLGKPEGIRAGLQKAIELEHATIPAYLYALYSLKPGRNIEIAEIVRSVVKEEMLHMTLACNLLNAIGGSPALDKPSFLPSYPGVLPGAVAEGLIVPLEPLSLDLVKNVFMVIEEPEKPLVFPVLNRALWAAPEIVSIGQFYAEIQRQIKMAGTKVFSNAPHRQVRTGVPGVVEVVDVESAVAAIEIIVEQGEGTPKSPLDPEGDLAHYYRFSEIFHGRRIVKNPRATADTPPDEWFEYAGAKLMLDPDGIWGIPKNPRRAAYPERSQARHAIDNFNYAYTSLLKTLHKVFNGEPERLSASMGLMFSLQQQAIDMMSGSSTGGENVGPSFEFQPLNCA